MLFPVSTITLNMPMQVYISLSLAAHREPERTSGARTGQGHKASVRPSPERRAVAHRLVAGKTERAEQESHPLSQQDSRSRIHRCLCMPPGSHRIYPLNLRMRVHGMAGDTEEAHREQDHTAPEPVHTLEDPRPKQTAI